MFGLVEARVSDADQLIHRITVDRKCGDAVIDGDARRQFHGAENFRESSTHALAEGESLRSVRLRQKQGEFVAAQAERGVRGAEGFLKSGGNGAQYVIAPQVSELIIHFLEAVQIERDKAERVSVAFRAIEFLFKQRIKEPAILKTGEGIGDSAALESFQIIAFDEQRKAEHARRSEDIHERGQKRYRLRGRTREQSSALQDFVPKIERAFF